MKNKKTAETEVTKENKPTLNLKNDIVFKAFFSRKGKAEEEIEKLK